MNNLITIFQINYKDYNKKIEDIIYAINNLINTWNFIPLVNNHRSKILKMNIFL